MKLARRSLKSAEDRRLKEIEAEEKAYIREGVLTGLLIDVADAFHVKLETVQSGQKKQLTVAVRTIFYYVARIQTEYPLYQLAIISGRKEHSVCLKHLAMVYDCFKRSDDEFLSYWNHYLANSKLFTSKDFKNTGINEEKRISSANA